MSTHDRPAPSPTPDSTRRALRAWELDKAANHFTSDVDLQRVLRHHLGERAYAAEASALAAFGAESATEIDALVRENNRDENLPALRRWDGLGHRTEQVVFHPSYAEIGRRIYRTGVIGRYAEPGHDRIQMAYAYLVGHHGEGGHLCPLACTAGLVKILQARADDALRAQLLPGLFHLDRTAPEHFHGAQFLTEIQGGSDVGANVVTARESPAGWVVSGEKWFCSVIDADLYLLTARPEGAPAGTAGLGAFVVPRLRPDGSPNGVFVRRLKTKLGTRSMASAEADFVDALAWPIGPVSGGFKAVVDIVLNTSRLYNAVAACGIMRRAEIEATTYARHREAFGGPIDRFPLVQRSLRFLARERRLAVAGTFELVSLVDRMALGTASNDDRDVFRLVVNMNKYWTSVRSTAAVHEAIEVLGGNGAIEDFSVLPRLWRDCIVLESWEGTHNVLTMQVLKDLHKFRLHEAYFRHLDALARTPTTRTRLDADRVAFEALLRLPADEASLALRDLIDRTMVTWQTACWEAVEGADAPALTDGSRPPF